MVRLAAALIPGNQVADGEETLGQFFRKLSNQLARAWALASGDQTLDDLRATAKFYEEVRVWMAKFDARERQSTDRPVPEEVRRFLAGLVDASTATGEIVDIYEAAGMPKPSLSDLGPGFTARERIRELINRYTNQQLTSAEVVAELIEPAREVAAEGNRGTTFDPPLSEDELAFYDAVSSNESAVELQGEESSQKRSSWSLNRWRRRRPATRPDSSPSISREQIAKVDGAQSGLAQDRAECAARE